MGRSIQSENISLKKRKPHHHHPRFTSIFHTKARVRRYQQLTLVLHKGLFCASSFFNPHSFMSFFTHSIHVFLHLPFLAPPTTSKFLHLETQSSASLRSTCPNHLSMPRLTTLSTPTIPSPHLSSSLIFCPSDSLQTST